MKKILAVLILGALVTGAVFADIKDVQIGPVREIPIMRLDTGNRVNADEIQKMFTALTTAYLKGNASYILAQEIYRDRGRQDGKTALILTELDYGNFTIINIRYVFSNGYFEFKLSRSPFTNVVNDEVVYSVDYDGVIDRSLYNTINNRLQEAVYISRGYAAMYKKTSSASFYWFR